MTLAGGGCSARPPTCRPSRARGESHQVDRPPATSTSLGVVPVRSADRRSAVPRRPADADRAGAAGTSRGRPRRLNDKVPARHRDDLPEGDGQGAAEALCQRPGAGRRTCARFPGRRGLSTPRPIGALERLGGVVAGATRRRPACWWRSPWGPRSGCGTCRCCRSIWCARRALGERPCRQARTARRGQQTSTAPRWVGAR